MKTPNLETRSIYRVTHRERGTVHHVAAESAQEACNSLGWLIEESHIFEVPKQQHPAYFSDTRIYVKLLCEICPYQYAECRKPEGTDCSVRSDVPDLHKWFQKVTLAHLCEYVGVDLERKDYKLRRKWLTIENAIKELSPSS